MNIIHHITKFPYFNYLNLAKLLLLLAIVVWEVGVVGEGNQGVCITYLTLLKTLHLNTFEKNLQKKKTLKLG